jgi:peptide/nickel transport system permease protein
MLTETRYGKWVARIARGNLGLSARDGEPIAPRLVRTAGITLAETGLALLVSFAAAIAVGLATALRRGRILDTVVAFVLLALHSVPSFWLAEALARAFTGRGILAATRMETPEAVRFSLATLTLTLASLAFLSREQRSAMLEVLRQDYVRTARAKGVPRLRLLLVHVLRNALVRTATLVSLQLPALLGMTIVVEEVFALPGFGYEMLQAVETADVAWLKAATMLAATLTTVSLALGDLALGALDPRVREAFGAPRPEVA